MTNDIFIARQAIFDTDRQTFGYELLYRAGPDSAAVFDDPDHATRVVLERAYLHWGIERLTGSRFGMVNASTELVRAGLHEVLPPEGVIIELRADETFDDATLDALVRARREGYHFALDNVTGLTQLVESPALEHASMVKVDLGHTDEHDLPAIVDYLRRRMPGLMIAAEKLQSKAEHEVCLRAGFDLFQGYYLARPDVLGKAARPADARAVAALTAEIQRPDPDIDRVERIVCTDPTLAYRVLAVVNSSAMGINRRAKSVRHAVLLLGVRQLGRMASLLSISASDDLDHRVLHQGIVRARLLGQLGSDEGLGSRSYTVGALSVLDLLYRTPMDDLLADLPVSSDIADALRDGDGELGHLLEIARACEDDDVGRLGELVPGEVERTRRAYAEAVGWAEEFRTDAGVHSPYATTSTN